MRPRSNCDLLPPPPPLPLLPPPLLPPPLLPFLDGKWVWLVALRSLESDIVQAPCSAAFAAAVLLAPLPSQRLFPFPLAGTAWSETDAGAVMRWCGHQTAGGCGATSVCSRKKPQEPQPTYTEKATRGGGGGRRKVPHRVGQCCAIELMLLMHRGPGCAGTGRKRQ